jgi:hypothetical protein
VAMKPEVREKARSTSLTEHCLLFDQNIAKAEVKMDRILDSSFFNWVKMIQKTVSI